MKKIYLIVVLLFTTLVTNAQLSQLSTVEQQIKSYFPIVAGIVFLFGVLANLNKLKGEDRDIKKFIISVLIYPGVLLVIVGVYQAIKNISL